MSQELKLLRLVSADGDAGEIGAVALESWRDGQWREIATDEEFALAFLPADAGDGFALAPAESAVVAPELEFAPGEQAVLLLPGSWVWSGLEVIPRAARRQSRAVGYMLEDQLAEDVDDLHFVCEPVDGDLCRVLAVSHSKMAALHRQLQRLGWPVIAALPEFVLAAAAGGNSGVWLERQWAHLWQAPGRGLSVGRSLLLPVAESLFADPERDDSIQAPSDTPLSDTPLSVIGDAGSLELAGLSQLGQVSSETESAENRFLAQTESQPFANLLTGEYQLDLGQSQSPWWKMPAYAVAACFVLQLLFFVVAGTYYKIEAGKAEAAARSLFSEIFPDDTPRADLRRQVQGYLNQASGGSGDFARKLQLLAKVWGEGGSSTLRMQSLRFDGSRGELVVQLRAANLGELDTVVNKLSSGQYRAELLAANELEDGVSGRIRLR